MARDPNPQHSLFLRLGASRQAVLVLRALQLGAAACPFASDLPVGIPWLLAAWALLYGGRCIGLHGSRRADRAIVLLIRDGQGRWRLRQRDGTLLEVALEPGAFVHPLLMLLPFRGVDGRRVSVLMVPDMVHGDDFRRLRVWLRCEPRRGP